MKKTLTGNKFIDFANEIAGRYKGVPGAFDSPMMNYLAEEKNGQSEETTLPTSITYINDITNIKEENILYRNNISFLTNILQKQFYRNFFPTVSENIEKIVKETVISENEKIYEKVSENAEKIAYDQRNELVSRISTQIINRISGGSTDTLEYLKSVPELAGKEEILYRRILNVLPEKKKEEAGIVTTKTLPVLSDEQTTGHKVFKMTEVPVTPVKKTSKNISVNSNSTLISSTVNNTSSSVISAVYNNFSNTENVDNSITDSSITNTGIANNSIANNSVANNSITNNSFVNNSVADNIISTDNTTVVNNGSTVTNNVFNSESFKSESFNSSEFTSNVYVKGTSDKNGKRVNRSAMIKGRELVYLEQNETQDKEPDSSQDKNSENVTAKTYSLENIHDRALIVKLVSDTVDKSVRDEVKNIYLSKKGTEVLKNAEILNNVLYQATERHLEKYYETVLNKNIFENENIKTLVKNVITNKVYRKLSEYVTRDNLNEIQLDEENISHIRNMVRTSYRSINKNITENIAKSIPADISENVLRNVSENVSKNISENISENVTENITENISRNVSENISKNILRKNSVFVSENISEMIHDDISDYLSDNKNDIYSDNRSAAESDNKTDFIRADITAVASADNNTGLNDAYSPISLEYNSSEDEEERQMLERVTGRIALNAKSAAMKNSSDAGLSVSEILLSAGKADKSATAEKNAVTPPKMVLMDENEKSAERIDIKAKSNSAGSVQMHGIASQNDITPFDSERILNNAERLILQYIPKDQAESLYLSTSVMAARNVARNELDHVFLEYADGEVSEQTAGEQIESIIGKMEKAYSDAGNSVFRNSSSGNFTPGNSLRLSADLSYAGAQPSIENQSLYDEATLVYGIDTSQKQEELTRQTRVLTEQVKEVQKNVTIVNQEKTVNEKEITDIAEKVVKNIVKKELKAPENVSETENLIRREASFQVASKMDENISNITDRVYQRLEQRLRTERGRRGLI